MTGRRTSLSPASPSAGQDHVPSLGAGHSRVLIVRVRGPASAPSSSSSTFRPCRPAVLTSTSHSLLPHRCPRKRLLRSHALLWSSPILSVQSPPEQRCESALAARRSPLGPPCLRPRSSSATSRSLTFSAGAMRTRPSLAGSALASASRLCSSRLPSPASSSSYVQSSKRPLGAAAAPLARQLRLLPSLPHLLSPGSFSWMLILTPLYVDQDLVAYILTRTLHIVRPRTLELAPDEAAWRQRARVRPARPSSFGRPRARPHGERLTGMCLRRIESLTVCPASPGPSGSVAAGRHDRPPAVAALASERARNGRDDQDRAPVGYGHDKGAGRRPRCTHRQRCHRN